MRWLLAILLWRRTEIAYLSFALASGSSRDSPSVLKTCFLCCLSACVEGSLVTAQSFSRVNHQPTASLPLEPLDASLSLRSMLPLSLCNPRTSLQSKFSKFWMWSGEIFRPRVCCRQPERPLRMDGWLAVWRRNLGDTCRWVQWCTAYQTRSSGFLSTSPPTKTLQARIVTARAMLQKIERKKKKQK